MSKKVVFGKVLPYFIDYGFVVLKRTSQQDGFFTFGKHRYQHISKKEVTRSYLAYMLVRLSHQPAGCPQEILDVIWFWGDRKGRIEAQLAYETGEGEYYADFDEKVEEQEEYYRREKMEQVQYVLPGVSRRGYRDGEYEEAIERLREDPYIQGLMELRKREGGI